MLQRSGNMDIVANYIVTNLQLSTARYNYKFDNYNGSQCTLLICKVSTVMYYYFAV